MPGWNGKVWDCSVIQFIDIQSRKVLYEYTFFFPAVVEVMKQIDIPSVFVGEDTSNSLKEEYAYDKG